MADEARPVSRADDQWSGSGGEPIAVVGMAGIFPGAAGINAYWANITAGVDAISTVPPNRIDSIYFAPTEHAGPEHLGTNRGGFVDAFATFDPTRFGVMPMAVPDAEPDQLIGLQVAADAIDDAGGRDSLGNPERIGVIVGRGGYLNAGVARLDQKVRGAQQLASVLHQLAPELGGDRIDDIKRAFQAAVGADHPDATIGLVPNLAASRISNRLDFQGPAFTVDAACASSLVAIDAAVKELRSGRCDSVIAGGMHHCHDITLWSVFSQLGALSPSGAIVLVGGRWPVDR